LDYEIGNTDEIDLYDFTDDLNIFHNS